MFSMQRVTEMFVEDGGCGRDSKPPKVDGDQIKEKSFVINYRVVFFWRIIYFNNN